MAGRWGEVGEKKNGRKSYFLCLKEFSLSGNSQRTENVGSNVYAISMNFISEIRKGSESKTHFMQVRKKNE